MSESKINRIGKIILIISILLMVAALYFVKYFSTGVMFIIGLFGSLIGGVIVHNYRSEFAIKQDHELMKKRIEVMAHQVQCGKSIDPNNLPEVRAARQKEETKQIVKGAVIGGIVAGNAGAVVGATIAKNKIDNEKK